MPHTERIGPALVLKRRPVLCSKAMRIGFFGGSFDPPHQGHLSLARLAADRLGLERVLFAPVGVQPLKRDRPQAGFADRVAMTEQAIAGEPRFEISLIDAPRRDGRPNYTLDTLRRLRDQLPAADPILCLMGADSFLNIGHWHRAAELLLSCDFAVASRPGFDLGRITGALPPAISVAACDQPPSAGLALCLRSRSKESRLYLLPDLAEEASASEIRALLARGADPRKVLPPAVAAWVLEHGLYRAAATA
jgi:nicotinate-nucleotide adenylyltransferase